MQLAEVLKVSQDELSMVFKLVLAFLLGSLLGIEREKRHKPAGIRTHALVCLGSAMFTLLSLYGFSDLSGLPQFRNMDPARVAAQVVVGVGFIGGGIIFKETDHIIGLTTAASIWVTASLGMGLAVGLYLPVLTTALLVLLALKFSNILKDRQ